MPYRNLEPLSKQLTIVIGLTVVGCMAFGLALSYYRNFLFEQTLDTMLNRNTMLREQIAAGYRNLEYYKSAQYKDKYAKENLNLVSPEERVLIFTQQPQNLLQQELVQEAPTERQEAAYFELLHQMPVLEHWKLFLFHRKKIDELKMNL